MLILALGVRAFTILCRHRGSMPIRSLTAFFRRCCLQPRCPAIREAIELCLEVEGKPERDVEFVSIQGVTIAA